LTRRAKRFSIPTLVALLVIVAIAPTAGAATLQGQVVGAAYPDGSRVSVPVLLADKSVKAGRLKTSLVRLSLSASARVAAAGGPVPVTKLRVGDAFKVRSAISKSARTATYPKLRSTRLKLTKRGSTPSVAELAEQLEELTKYVHGFASYTDAQLTDLRSQLASLRADLGTLSALVAAVQASIPGLPADPANTLTMLIAQVSSLQTQLNDLTSQLTGATSEITSLASQLTGFSASDLAGALTDISQLQTLLGGVNVATLNTQLATLLGNIGGTNASVLTGQLGTLQTTLGTATSQLSFLCSSAGLVKGNPLLGILGLSNLTACS